MRNCCKTLGLRVRVQGGRGHWIVNGTQSFANTLYFIGWLKNVGDFLKSGFVVFKILNHFKVRVFSLSLLGIKSCKLIHRP